MNRYESRHCTFEVPEDWEPQPPFGFAKVVDGIAILSAQMLERFLALTVTAADHAAKEKELLPHCLDECVFLSEGPLAAAGIGTAHRLVFTYLDDDGGARYEQRIYAMVGPLLCELSLTGPAGADPARDTTFEGIRTSLSLVQVDYLAKAAAMSLRPVESGEKPRWAGRVELPDATVSVPLPEGWDHERERAGLRLRWREREIGMHRLIGVDAEPADWFAATMKRLQERAQPLLGSEQGDLDDGRPFAAVCFDERDPGRNWSTRTERRCLEVLIADHQPLHWTLRAESAAFETLRPILAGMILATERLPEKSWETPLAEEWIDLTLRGPWTCEGPGIYANVVEGPTVVYAGAVKADVAMARVRASATESLRPGLGRIEREEEAEGLHQGREAFRYSADGTGERSKPLGVRAVWVRGKGVLYSVVIHGRDRLALDGLFPKLLDGLRIAD